MQYLCDIGAVMVRFLYDLTETQLALIKLRIGVTLNNRYYISILSDSVLKAS